MKRVLILVMSSQQPPYDALMRKSMETWDSIHVEGVRTRYYCGNPVKPHTPKVSYFPFDNELFNLGRLTLAAYSQALLENDWDYIARVNASCYVHKARLLARCAVHPAAGLLSGSIVQDTTRPTWMWGGHQFVLSRDVVQAVVDNARLWNHTQMEDVALSYAATAIGIPFTQTLDACGIDRLGPDEWRAISTNGKNLYFTNWADVAKLDSQIFFRVKRDGARHEDIEVMQNLHTHLTR